jgi:hypothetical protein
MISFMMSNVYYDAISDGCETMNIDHDCFHSIFDTHVFSSHSDDHNQSI